MAELVNGDYVFETAKEQVWLIVFNERRSVGRKGRVFDALV